MINLIKNIKGIKNPFLLFLPFLLLYFFIIVKFHPLTLIGDESRYIDFSYNLIHGFYSSPAPAINLWNGPGYPIFLIPFLLLKIPLIFVLFANALFYYFSIVLLFKILQPIVSFKFALIVCMFWGFYYNAYQDLLLKCTEILTSFLITLFLFLLIKAFDSNTKNRKKYVVFAGLTLGYLVLTKIIFAYVLVALLIYCSILFVTAKTKLHYKKGAAVMLIAFFVISPYLLYTYNLTGRVFYLGNSGGMSLYWMSTPYADEYGDWFDENGKAEKSGNYLSSYENELRINHQEDHEEIFKYQGVERDDAYKKIAIRNIKNNPIKFLKNWGSNIGRLFFSYPYTYTLQSNKNLLRLPMSGLLVLLMLFSLIPTMKNWKKIIFPVQLILIFFIVYLGLSTLLSAYTRMFTVVVPIALFWISFILPKVIKVKKTEWTQSDYKPSLPIQ